MKKFYLIFLFALVLTGCDDVDYDKVNASGKPAVVQILKVTDTRTTINDNPRVDLDIKVYTKDGEPYTTMITRTVSRVDIPRRGDLRSAKVDPNDKTQIILLYEEDAAPIQAELDEIARKVNPL